jgi:hypothetical protein
MDRFIRHQNVKHFRSLLKEAKTDDERDRIKKLLAEEQQKQIESGDPLTEERQAR